MIRCMEIQWKGPGVFAHRGGPQDWASVVENARVAAVRRLQEVDFGEWTAVYEVDQVVGLDERQSTQYLVAEPCSSDSPVAAK